MEFTSSITLLIAATSQLVSATWWDSCDRSSSYLYTPGNYLNAQCNTDFAGVSRSNILQLSDCIGNSNGFLQCSDWGNMGASCDDCSMIGPTLQCRCRTEANIPIYTHVNTGDCIDNFDGYLKCYGHQ